MKQFEVGKSYSWADICFDPFTVLSRTEKTIKVTNGVNTWRMRIRHDEDGDEWVRDSSMGDRSKYSLFISRPIWEDKTWNKR